MNPIRTHFIQLENILDDLIKLENVQEPSKNQMLRKQQLETHYENIIRDVLKQTRTEIQTNKDFKEFYTLLKGVGNLVANPHGVRQLQNAKRLLGELKKIAKNLNIT